ncbi:MAG: hypothetical protein IPI34_15005 [bacterium]|nr:hypothetical protein [bacterium]
MLDNDLRGRALVAHESAPTSSVLPFLPGLRPWYADVQESGTFVTWNREYADNRAIAPEEAALRAAVRRAGSLARCCS